MPNSTTVTVRLGDALSEFVAERILDDGAYQDAGEYLRELIRHDKARLEREAFERLKLELQQAFTAPESAYQSLDAAEVIARNRH